MVLYDIFTIRPKRLTSLSNSCIQQGHFRLPRVILRAEVYD